MSQKNNHIHDASFRDPSGHLFYDQGILRRHITPLYFKQYQSLSDSGFYETLINKGLLIKHTETSRSEDQIVITPEPIPFITNPYEWSFEQYKEAALLTLRLQKFALSKGYILKDASAYNITLHKGKPILIDTLSFDFYEEGTPWRGYKQFVSHFFGPLILAKYHGTEVLKMMQTHIDGIPLALISSMLPLKTKLNAIIQTNIHLLAKMEAKHQEDYKSETKMITLSRKAQNYILQSLFDHIKKLKIKSATEWGDYYTKTNYEQKAFDYKKTLIRSWIKELQPERVIDLGGNDGTFARTIQDQVGHLIVTDIDAVAIDQNYKQIQENKEDNMLTFVSDLLQPAPGIGFQNTERNALIDRLKTYAPDTVMALALIHHITLSGNVPFEKTANFLAMFSKDLIIEFPKREDSWVASLLKRKREFIAHFNFYNQQQFETSFETYFELIKKEPIPETARIMYHYRVKNNKV